MLAHRAAAIDWQAAQVAHHGDRRHGRHVRRRPASRPPPLFSCWLPSAAQRRAAQQRVGGERGAPLVRQTRLRGARGGEADGGSERRAHGGFKGRFQTQLQAAASNGGFKRRRLQAAASDGGVHLGEHPQPAVDGEAALDASAAEQTLRASVDFEPDALDEHLVRGRSRLRVLGWREKGRWAKRRSIQNVVP